MIGFFGQMTHKIPISDKLYPFRKEFKIYLFIHNICNYSNHFEVNMINTIFTLDYFQLIVK
jgi:hypothetical protein